MSFAKDIGENISKNASGKYNQKLPDHAKQSANDALKTSSKRVIQNTAEAIKYAIMQYQEIKKVLKNSQQDNLKTILNKNDKEVPK